jgi:hypothetical protein
MAVLVHGTSEIVLLAADADEHLIKEPSIARPWPAPLQCVSEHMAEAEAPVADALIRQRNAAGGQDRLDLTQAEAEAVIKLDRVLDHLGREAEAAVGVGRPRHARHAATTRPGPPPDDARRSPPTSRQSRYKSGLTPGKP